MTTTDLCSPDVTTQAFTLTPDQQNALSAFSQFLCDPRESAFVLSGFSGCGKTTLVKTLLTKLPYFLATARLIEAGIPNYNVELTATTNKAAENLTSITGTQARTIHSFLGLRLVPVDIRKREYRLEPKNGNQVTNTILFIDEASFVNPELLGLIFKLTDPKSCKIVFVGDPAQLLQPKSNSAPVFDAKFCGAALTQVVRQAEGNPIVDLSTQFRHTVSTGVWPQFKPDGHHVQYLTGDQFKAAILKEFGRPDWRYHDSKVLGFTNDFVEQANMFIRNHVEGSPHLEVGDYAVCNSFVQLGKNSIKTDQLVHITGIEPQTRSGVAGVLYTIDYAIHAFMPESRQAKAQRIKEAKARNEMSLLWDMEQTWIDLRPVFAQTINKSQGSTYDKVFIDLDDVSRCHVGDQIARMLYVGVSRARNHVYLTGDIA